MNRTSLLFLAALTACAPSGAADVTVPGTTPTGTTEPVEQDKPVVGLDLSTVAIYQGVEIVLYDDNDELPAQQAPMIRQRDAMLRVFVRTGDVFESRRVRAVLEVETNNGVETFEEKVRISGNSKRADLDSTFNFDIPGDLMKANTRFAVSLYEANASEPWVGDEGSTTWDSGSIGAEKSDVLNVVLLPVRYNADGSGRVPPTSQSQIDAYRNTMLSMYPVEDVVIEVTEPVDWNQPIGSNGSGWSDLLYAVADLRDGANVDPNTYYYAIFEPEDSFMDFCSFGCVLGLSNLAWNTSDPWYRSSIGLGYQGFQNMAANTFVHEVGHAHGRQHANCGGAQGIDPQYPYSPNAIIGSWGYDTRTGTLYDPDENHDMMAYCDPMWISDYQYYQIFLQVTAVGNVARQAKIPWQTVTVGMDGTAKLDKVRNFTPNLGGEPVQVELIDAVGRVVDTVDGLFSPLSHIDGGMVMIPTLTNPAVVDVRVPALEK